MRATIIGRQVYGPPGTRGQLEAAVYPTGIKRATPRTVAWHVADPTVARVIPDGARATVEILAHGGTDLHAVCDGVRSSSVRVLGYTDAATPEPPRAA